MNLFKTLQVKLTIVISTLILLTAGAVSVISYNVAYKTAKTTTDQLLDAISDSASEKQRAKLNAIFRCLEYFLPLRLFRTVQFL